MNLSDTANLYKRKDSPHWWMRAHVDGRAIRVSLKTHDLEEAAKRRDALINRYHADSIDVGRSDWRKRCLLARDTGGSWLRALCNAANHRNKKFGWRPVTLQTVYRLAVKSRGRCAVTGIPFAWDGESSARGAYAISIDRIKPGKPYSAKNCRMVLRSVNLAMHVWGEQAFWDIACKAVGRRLMKDDFGQKPEQRIRPPKSVS